MTTNDQENPEQHRIRKIFGFETFKDFIRFENNYGENLDFVQDLRDDFNYIRKAQEYEDGFELVLDELVDYDWKSFNRRTLVRTLFAMIEGTCYVFKQKALYMAKTPWFEPTEIELQKLSEKTKKGKDRYLSIECNVKFAFPIFARAWDTSFDFTYTDDDEESTWETFREVIHIRHRLMHPKQESDLKVTDSEKDITLKSAEWFIEQVDRLDSLWWPAFRRLIASEVE